MRSSVLFFALVACGGGAAPIEDAYLPVEQAPVTGLTLNLPGHMVAGSTNSLSASGLSPGETVYFGASAAGVGPGPCLAAAGGQCLDIRNPVRLLGTAIADGNGNASLVITAPAGAAGRSVGLQAVVVRGPGGSSSELSAAVSDAVEAPTPAAVSVELVTGNMPIATACAGGDYDCQAREVCESVTGTTCLFQDYECYSGSQGSYYPLGGAGSSDFNFSRLGVEGGWYGNICGCDEVTYDSYGLARLWTYCGLGEWHRAP